MLEIVSEKGPGHQFGGNWTERKLDIVAHYLKAYTTALNSQPFKKLYVDAFAGTGYRDARREDSGAVDAEDLLFPDLAEPEPQGLLDGSARRALAICPPFDRYVFIERVASRCAQLEGLKQFYPKLAGAIEVRRGEANATLQNLCHGDWHARRAVVFLDPYGMQVEWATLEAIAGTRAIDLWILFPLGIGVNRLLTKSGVIPESWRRRLDLLLGTTDWYDEFYRFEATPTLFETDEERVIKASTETIGRYFVRRLEGIFHSVAPEPAVLRNSRNVPLYLLCFAAGNPRGAKIALKIANHLLERMG